MGKVILLLVFLLAWLEQGQNFTILGKNPVGIVLNPKELLLLIRVMREHFVAIVDNQEVTNHL